MIKKNLIAIGAIVSISIVLLIVFIVINNANNEKILKLIESFYDAEDYETAYLFAQNYLLKNPENKDALDWVKRIKKAQIKPEENESYNVLFKKIDESFENNQPADNSNQITTIQNQIYLLNKKLETLALSVSQNEAETEMQTLKNTITALEKKIDNITEQVSQPVYVIGNEESGTSTVKINTTQNNNLVSEGLTLYESGVYPKAKENFKSALKDDKNNSLANTYLSAILLKEDVGNTENYMQIIKYCSRAIESDSTNALAHFILGSAYFNHSELKLASDYLKQSLVLDSSNIEAKYMLGKITYQQSQYDESISYLKDVCNVEPNNTDALYWFGLSYSKNNNQIEAILVFEKVVNLDPSFFAVYQKLGELYYNLADYRKALSSYQKAYKLNPSKENEQYVLLCENKINGKANEICPPLLFNNDFLSFIWN